MMARARHHAGGAKSKLSQRFVGDRPGVTPRTLTIKNYVDSHIFLTGLIPSVDNVAKMFCMTRANVEHHYRVLGLL
jgi:hypothetical protein